MLIALGGFFVYVVFSFLLRICADCFVEHTDSTEFFLVDWGDFLIRIDTDLYGIFISWGLDFLSHAVLGDLGRFLFIFVKN